jgi:hypothetical protein
MYSDKDKQREAVRMATKRYRLRKGITKVSPELSDTRENEVIPVIPVTKKEVIAKRDSQPVPDWRAQKDAQMAEFIKRSVR